MTKLVFPKYVFGIFSLFLLQPTANLSVCVCVCVYIYIYICIYKISVNIFVYTTDC